MTVSVVAASATVARRQDRLSVVLAGRARHLISEMRLCVVNKISGALLMAGGVWLALQHRA